MRFLCTFRLPPAPTSRWGHHLRLPPPRLCQRTSLSPPTWRTPRARSPPPACNTLCAALHRHITPARLRWHAACGRRAAPRRTQPLLHIYLDATTPAGLTKGRAGRGHSALWRSLRAAANQTNILSVKNAGGPSMAGLLPFPFCQHSRLATHLIPVPPYLRHTRVTGMPLPSCRRRLRYVPCRAAQLPRGPSWIDVPTPHLLTLPPYCLTTTGTARRISHRYTFPTPFLHIYRGGSCRACSGPSTAAAWHTCHARRAAHLRKHTHTAAAPARGGISRWYVTTCQPAAAAFFTQFPIYLPCARTAPVERGDNLRKHPSAARRRGGDDAGDGEQDALSSAPYIQQVQVLGGGPLMPNHLLLYLLLRLVET